MGTPVRRRRLGSDVAAKANRQVEKRFSGYIAPDTTKPVITMLGTSPIDHPVTTAYTDAGATAHDNRDGDITANIVELDNVDSNVVGSYTVKYNVVDAAGNNAIAVIRTVNVV